MGDASLQIHRVLDAVAARTASDLGALRAASMSACAHVIEASGRMALVEAARRLRIDTVLPRIAASLLVEPLLERARRSGILEGEELLVFARLARSAANVEARREHWETHAVALAVAIEELPDLVALSDLILDAIDDDGTLRDAASETLARLRREVRGMSAGLRDRVGELVRETDDRGLLQDDYFTLREGRYVLPVRASDKRQVDGIVHGSSHTGQTYYIEPAELIAANNRLALAQDEVRREERRILAELSGVVDEHREPVRMAVDCLAGLDVVFAAADLSDALHATAPSFSDDGTVDLRAARHPILVLDRLTAEGPAVVGNDIRIAAPARWLVVSGPNGGGKTVLLTTLGLAAQMAGRGLPVCASSDSTLPFFAAVEVVLGDAQDLDRGLSTFAGHLKRVQAALDAVDRARATDGDQPILLLLDELAGGTEPSAGSALATAILEAFGARSCHGAVATHFEALKLLALRSELFENAALTLDPHTQEPTFRLRIGEFGTSSPFALAARMGLDAGVVERARQIAGEGSHETDSLVERLSQLRRTLDDEVLAAERERRMLSDARQRLEDQRRHEKRAADQRIHAAAGDALGQLQAATAAAGMARDALRKATNERQVQEAARELQRHHKTASALRQEAELRLGERVERKPAQSADVRLGGELWHAGLGRPVTVFELDPGNRRIGVRAGVMELRARLDELFLPPPTKAKQAPKPYPLRRPPPAQPPPPDGDTEIDTEIDIEEDDTGDFRRPESTCDLRGERVEEALEALDAHLDRAVVAGRRGACVVHGIGTGAVRKAVRNHLHGHAQVRAFRPGRRGEGGEGATMVWVRV